MMRRGSSSWGGIGPGFGEWWPGASRDALPRATLERGNCRRSGNRRGRRANAAPPGVAAIEPPVARHRKRRRIMSVKDMPPSADANSQLDELIEEFALRRQS